MADVQVIDRPSRWDVPFGLELPDPDERRTMTDAEVDAVMAAPMFASMDPAKFPRSQPLRDIIRYDTRIRRFRKGDVIVRQGDYGNSAFLVLGGEVRFFADLEARVLGRRAQRSRSLWRSLVQGLTNPRTPELRDTRTYEQARHAGEAVGDAAGGDGAGAALVTNVMKLRPDIFDDAEGDPERRGAFFGELAALGRTPRSVSVVASDEAELLEIRWQGLRDLRKHDEALKWHLDYQYRNFRLAAALRDSALLKGLDDDAAERVAAAAEFETYGRYDWYGSYQKLRREHADPLAHEPVIAREGDYPAGLILVRTGFVRLSRSHGHGERTLSYLGQGGIYGLSELVHNAVSGEQVSLKTSLRAIGFVDVVRIPTVAFEQYILPTIPRAQLEALLPAPTTQGNGNGRDVSLPIATPVMTPAGGGGAADIAGPRESAIDPATLEFLVENRFINGTATMVIDMDRCTRCDDCVRACASGHDNNPVFVRHGPSFGRYMVANACMHCVDPVCMIGCPTGAIHRDEDTGEVVINDVTCIGCTVCANNCPYDNIRMVEIRDKNNGGALCVGPQGQPILKATKCDLCIDHHGGPACERACPHDALRRIDMREHEMLEEMLGR